MRGTWFALVVGLLLAPVLSGCFGDDAPEPVSSMTFEEAERQASSALSESETEPVLVGAFGLSAINPARLDEVSSDYPGIAALTRPLVETALAPTDDGRLSAWAYIYEQGPGPLKGVVVVGDASGLSAVEAFSEQDNIRVFEAEVQRAELVLLGANANATMSPLGVVDSMVALEAARTVPEWGSATQGDDAFILFTLAAGPTDLPEWRMVAGQAAAKTGTQVRVNATDAEIAGGPYPWPDPAVEVAQIDHTAFRMPGDVAEFTIQVENRSHPEMNLHPQRTATGALVADPVVELIAPGGDATPLTLNEWYTVDQPARGEWTVRYTWEVPDVSRSIQLHTCLEPRVFLFAEGDDEGECTTEGDFSPDRL